MTILRQSTAVTVKLGPFLDSTDGNTAETGLTLQKADIRLTKNGGDMAAANADQGVADAGAAHDELGYYDISLDTTDTNTVGRLKVMVHEAGALAVWGEFQVVEEAVYDALFAASAAGYSTYAGGDTSGVTTLLSRIVGTLLAGNHTAQSGDSYALANGDHGFVSIQDDIDAILADTNELQTNQGNWLTATGFSTHSAADVVTALGTGTTLTAIPWNAAWDAEVQSECSDALTAAALTAAGIADAVLDEAMSGHTTAGTLGKAVADILDDTGTTLPAAIALVGGGAGSGADSVTITWNDNEGSPIPNGQLWISSDAAGDTVVAGTLVTDSNGQATFQLDAGSTYYLWAQADGYNSLQGTQFTAVAD